MIKPVIYSKTNGGCKAGLIDKYLTAMGVWIPK